MHFFEPRLDHRYRTATILVMQTQDWQPTGIHNLFVLNGHYYLRVKPKGQARIRESLHTDNKQIAMVRMRDRLLEIGLEPRQSEDGTWGGLVEQWLSMLDAKHAAGDIEERTVEYKKDLIKNIRLTWQGFDQEKLSDTVGLELGAWRAKHCTKYSAPRANGAQTVLRELLALARELKMIPDARREELLRALKFAKVKYDYKRLTLQLPTQAQMDQLELEIYRRCQVRGTLGGYLFSFLRYSGCRIDSAAHVLRCDVFRDRGQLHFRKAKYGPYTIPLFPQLLAVIDRIEQNVPGGPDDQLLPTVSLQTVLRSACKQLMLSHLSHHDLRHVFATRCIEQGVPVPTVASWLGHKDGGRTVMQIYGHLRQEHSDQEAKRVTL